MSTNYISQITATDGITYDVQEGVTTRIFRATCSTAPATAAKVATLDDETGYSLAAGVRVAVTFTYGNTATSPTLNVNSGGAKNIYYRTAASTTQQIDELCVWGASETVIFTYNGSSWIMMGSSLALYNAYNKAASSGSGTITEVKTNAGAHTTIDVLSGKAEFNVPTKTSHLTNDSGFITSYTETDPVFSASAAAGITATDISNWNAKSSTDEKLAVAEVSDSNTYYPIFGSGTTAATRLYDSNGLKYQSSTVAALTLGSLNQKRGSLQLFNGSYYINLTSSTLTAARTIYLPNKAGTIALTSDIPDVSGYSTTDENVKQENTTSSSTYRVLLSHSAGDTTETNISYKSTNLKFTPSTGKLSVTGEVGSKGLSSYVTGASGSSYLLHDKSNYAITLSNTNAMSGSSKITLSSASITLSRTPDGSSTAIEYIKIPSNSETAGITVTGLKTPASDSDAATKKYVDDSIGAIPAASITLNGTSTTSASFYAPTNAGTSGYYLKSNGSGAPTWANFPTIPSITLNGSSTTSPSFYAPTTVGTSGYVLKSSGSGAPSWSTLAVTDIPTLAQTKISANSASIEFDYTGDSYTTNSLSDVTNALIDEIDATQTAMENITAIANSKPNIKITRW